MQVVVHLLVASAGGEFDGVRDLRSASGQVLGVLQAKIHAEGVHAFGIIPILNTAIDVEVVNIVSNQTDSVRSVSTRQVGQQCELCISPAG